MPEAAYSPLFTAAQVRELDRTAIEDKGIPGYRLMCLAGDALARHIRQQWPNAAKICVLCGPGNNAGDGYVLARLLRDSSIDVELIALCDPGKLRDDARQAAQDYLAGGGAVKRFSGLLPRRVDLLVDALLGTGLDRAVEGDYRKAIELLNIHAAPVVAVDIPSGLHADTGRILGAAVEAHSTVTFIGRKRGLYSGAGIHCAGKVDFNGLAVPPEIYQGQDAAVQLVEQPPLGPLFTKRRRDAHKGDFGHVLVVGGNRGMAGAARLAAEAAARCGSGLVSVATRGECAAIVNAGCAELMVLTVEETASLDSMLSRATVVVIGPGLGQTDWSRSMLERVLDSKLPLVVDADALNLLAKDPLPRGNWILTPHPGEAGRLLQLSTRAVQDDRFSAARDLQEKYQGVVVLKGAGSLSAAPAEPLRLCGYGNPGMAAAGMGDVLSGVLGALLAQGMTLFDAATSGVFLHARAGDDVAGRQGERGLLASDLIPRIRELINGIT